MASESSYYVPENSWIPVLTATSLGSMALGAGLFVQGKTPLILLAGVTLLACVLFTWFSTVIGENMRGMTNAQVKRSFTMAMGWFIFSEVMFFAAFFGALFYVRVLAVPWLGGEGEKAMTNSLLWQGFSAQWPVMQTPDQVLGGTKFVGPHENMGFPGWGKVLEWLPLWNTILLLTSSWTVHIAHHAMKHGNRTRFNVFLAITVALGLAFVAVQYREYHEAYTTMGLTLKSGIYGTTFFMLTGFHGFHVCLGAFMLSIQLLRGLKGHFKPDDQFGFEASSWYWHFVDVVWLGLFIFVYVLG
ncbi:MAG: cytochrome c oxidase subunit 3 [Porticoccaceae bacterium]|nr:cytochrome c oxidase subunit 3 [Gammaproteobacteria bacterium]TAL05393.1 MAG: cytochrome c oxidase subunit 3 [Porticoccaceae bacterium]